MLVFIESLLLPVRQVLESIEVERARPRFCKLDHRVSQSSAGGRLADTTSLATISIPPCMHCHPSRQCATARTVNNTHVYKALFSASLLGRAAAFQQAAHSLNTRCVISCCARSCSRIDSMSVFRLTSITDIEQYMWWWGVDLDQISGGQCV